MKTRKPGRPSTKKQRAKWSNRKLVSQALMFNRRDFGGKDRVAVIKTRFREKLGEFTPELKAAYSKANMMWHSMPDEQKDVFAMSIAAILEDSHEGSRRRQKPVLNEISRRLG